jgi:hypothetical protein
MARTFIGELVLRLKDEMSGKAKTAAANLDTSIDRIQRAARKMSQTSWGGQFEERLRKLGASSADIDKLRVAWDSLHTSMSSRNLSKAMQSLEKSNFKLAATQEFSALAAAAKDADTNIGRMHSRWKEAAKDIAAYGTIGTLLYGGANAVRGGVNASAEFQKEIFKQENARIPQIDQLRIAAEADRLTSLYPSAGLVNVMELARSSQAMMGSVDRGLAVLPDLVKAYVALQSIKGIDAAPDELKNLMRGIDNAGKNKDGQLGIDATRDIIAGMVRASQIEDKEFDVGKLFQFARRGKIAVPGLSTEFLANVSPAFMQDMTPEGFGTALSSAYQAFVIGSNAVASKKNIARQEEIGIRDEKGLIDSDLFGTNPYAWVKKNLIPALQKQGVDMSNETAVAKEVAQLTRNTNASGLLTRMITQQQQVDRLLEQYANAVGPGAADSALTKDPFVAWKGFVESWRELATAIKGMPEAVGILNSMTDGLQRFATALRNNDGTAQAALAGAGIAGGFAAWKITAAIWGLMTAGTNLNAAAVALQAAAVSLGAQGAMNDLDAKKPGKFLSKLKEAMPWLAAAGARVAGPVGAGLTTYEALNSVPHDGYGSVLKDNPTFLQDMERDRRRRAEYPGGFEGGMHTAGAGLAPYPGSWLPKIDFEIRTDSIEKRPTDQDRSAETTPAIIDVEQPEKDEQPAERQPERAVEPIVNVEHGISQAEQPTQERRTADAYGQNAETRQAAGVSSNPQVTPEVDMSSADAAASEASRLGAEILHALSVSARPSVDNGSLRETLALVNAIRAGLQGIGAMAQQAHSSVSRQMRRNFADHGVSP